MKKRETINRDFILSIQCIFLNVNLSLFELNMYVEFFFFENEPNECMIQQFWHLNKTYAMQIWRVCVYFHIFAVYSVIRGNSN